MNNWNSKTVGTIMEGHSGENQGITTEDIVALTNIRITSIFCIISNNFQLHLVCFRRTLFTLLMKKCKQEFINAVCVNRCFKMIRLSKDCNRWWEVMKLVCFILIHLTSSEQVYEHILIIRLPKNQINEFCWKGYNDFFRS